MAAKLVLFSAEARAKVLRGIAIAWLGWTIHDQCFWIFVPAGAQSLGTSSA